MGNLRDSLMKGEIKWGDMNPTLRKLIEESGFNHPRLYDNIAAPVISNMMERAVGSDDSKVYSKREIDDIFSGTTKRKPSGPISFRIPEEDGDDIGSSDARVPYYNADGDMVPTNRTVDVERPRPETSPTPVTSAPPQVCQ